MFIYISKYLPFQSERVKDFLISEGITKIPYKATAPMDIKAIILADTFFNFELVPINFKIYLTEMSHSIMVKKSLQETYK